MVQIAPVRTGGEYTRALAEFALSIEAGDLPADVVHEARRVLLDCVGSTIAGLVTDAGKIAVGLARDEHGPLEARVVGAGRATVAQAALANMVLCNAIDFEVYGPEGHVCAVAMPAAVAMADALDASGAELLAGLVAAIEIGGRIGGAIRRVGQVGGRATPVTRGHPHACFSAAAGAGRLLKLTPGQMVNALGIAGYSATLPSLRKFFESPNPPMTKYDHLGVVTQSGVAAALMAQRGFTGDPEVLEGSIQFWQLAGALGCDWDFLLKDLGQKWTISELWYKPYPVGLPELTVLDLARQLMRENHLQPAQIDRVEVRLPPKGRIEIHRPLTNSINAWLDGPYNLAAGMYDVLPMRSWQEPSTFRRPDVLALAERVTFGQFREDEPIGAGNYWEGWAPVRMTIEAGGRTYEGANDFIRPLSDRELSEKFQDNVSGLMSASDATRLEQLCWEFPDLPSSRQLTDVFPSQMPA
jgi:2-methylcitrate dehydratase PrpD